MPARLSGDATAKPRLMDLADNLSVAAAADIVAFVYRAGFYRPMDASLVGKAELILAKNVHGETGAIPLRFSREFGLFESARN